MLNVEQNLKILRLMKELSINERYAAAITDKDKAIRNLEKIQEIKSPFWKVPYTGYWKRWSEGIQKRILQDESFPSFLFMIDREVEEESKKIQVLERVGNILDFLPDFSEVKSESLISAAEQAGCWIQNATNRMFLLYNFLKDGKGNLAGTMEKKGFVDFTIYLKDGESVLSACDGSKITISELEMLNSLPPHMIPPGSDKQAACARRCASSMYVGAVSLAGQYLNTPIVSMKLAEMPDERIAELKDLLEKIFSDIKIRSLEEERKTICAGILRNIGKLEYDLEILRNFFRRLPGMTDSVIVSASVSRVGFLNACTGNRYVGLVKKIQEPGVETECQENLMEIVEYAIVKKKKAFLSLMDSDTDMFLSLPAESLLFSRDFWQICNLNTLNTGDIRRLNKKGLKTTDLSFFKRTGGTYTFNEVATVCTEGTKIQSIYTGLEIENIDLRLKTIRQLLHSSVSLSELSADDCRLVAGMLSKKTLEQYMKDFSYITGLSKTRCIQLLCLFQGPLQQAIRDARSRLDTTVIVRNKNNPLLIEKGLKLFKESFLEYDEDSRWILERLELPEEEVSEHRETIEQFCMNGYAAIVRIYYERQSQKVQRKNILLIAKAAMFGKLGELKYADLDREIDHPLDSPTTKLWEENTAVSKNTMSTSEYDDFLHSISIGTMTGDTCMSYRDGVYNECLLSTFDGNKKVLYTRMHGEYAGRSLLRLTKFSDTPENSAGLGFMDVSDDTQASKEKLVLFLERFYSCGLNDYHELNARKQMIRLAQAKADRMQAKLIVANDYHAAANSMEDLKPVKVNGYMYISKSKNGNQYLDSLGGNCEEGGYYKNGEFLFTR